MAGRAALPALARPQRGPGARPLAARADASLLRGAPPTPMTAHRHRLPPTTARPASSWSRSPVAPACPGIPRTTRCPPSCRAKRDGATIEGSGRNRDRRGLAGRPFHLVFGGRGERARTAAVHVAVSASRAPGRLHVRAQRQMRNRARRSGNGHAVLVGPCSQFALRQSVASDVARRQHEFLVGKRAGEDYGG